MGLFSFLSAAKTADALVGSIPKVISSAIKGIDASFFTDEEKMGFVKDLSKQLYDNFMPRAISRRVLSIIIFGIFGVFSLSALVFACFDMMSIVDNIIKVALAMKIGWMTITVTAFYFGIWPIGKGLLGKK